MGVSPRKIAAEEAVGFSVTVRFLKIGCIFLFFKEFPERKFILKVEMGFEKFAAPADEPSVDQCAENRSGFDPDEVTESIE